MPTSESEELETKSEEKEEEKPLSDSQLPSSSSSEKHDHPLSNFFNKNASVKKSKDDDELIDIHVGNPLKRITLLLEEIKNQKAFSFTLKGSLGIMGVALVIGTFGVFGGVRAFCDKGVQTRSGIVKTLIYQDTQKESWVDFVPILNSFFPKKLSNRSILVTPTNEIYSFILGNGVQLATNAVTPETTFYITGTIDSCSNTITIDNQNGIQPQ